MISGHKTRSVFDRYIISNDTDLKFAAQQESYLRAQFRAQSIKIGIKKELPRMANSLIYLVPEVGIEPT
ncbi:MAG: hypothetical protein AB1487_09350 [Thermodesulfobacteriota bacterium]